MSTEPKHYELGGSNAYRWRNCPGSVNLLRGLPSPPSGAAAIEGTDAHAWCEFFLQNPAFLHVLSFVGKKRPGDKESTVALTVEMATGVKLYVDYVKSFSDQYGAELFCEAKVLLSELSDRMGGTIDARVFARRYTEPIEVDGRWVFPAYHALDKLIGTSRILHIFDFKYGFAFVDEKRNDQLMFYAYGAWAQHRDELIDHIFVHIVQPRSHGEPIRCVEVDIFDLMDWGAETAQAAIETRKPGAKCVSGPWCDKTWCYGKVRCPALQDDFGVIDQAAQQLLAAGDTVSTVSEFGHNELCARIAEAMPHIKGAESYIKALEAEAYTLAGQGKLPGYKLVAGATRRAWNTEDGDADAIASVLSEHGLTPYQPKELISLTEAEKALGKQRFKELTDGLVVTKSNKPSLVPETDKRPAWTGDGAEGFEPIPTEFLEC